MVIEFTGTDGALYSFNPLSIKRVSQTAEGPTAIWLPDREKPLLVQENYEEVVKIIEKVFSDAMGD